MRFDKVIVPVSVSVAVVAAAIAAIVVTNNRAAKARADAVQAENLEIAKDKELKRQKSEERTQTAKLETERLNESAKQAELEANKLANATAATNAIIAAANLKASQLANDTAKREATKASELKAAKKHELETQESKSLQQREWLDGQLKLSNAVAVAAMAKLETEKRKNEAILAEAKVLELRKIDFDRLERDLLEYKQELDERERALHPDTSIYDSSNVTWVAERELEVIGETNRLRRAAKVLPENDPTLPKATRDLAKLDRLRHEASTNRLAVSQAKLLRELERLRDAAAKDGRVIDVNFYQKSIKSLNPDYTEKK